MASKSTAKVSGPTFSWETVAVAGAAVAGAAVGGYLLGKHLGKQEASSDEASAPASEYKTPPLYTFDADYLRTFTKKVFMHFGTPVRTSSNPWLAKEERAARAADVLASADLRGIDSHGVARLHAYFELLEAKAIEPNPDVKIVTQNGGACVVDGGNGLGLIVGPAANDIAIRLAREHGVAAVTVRNTNHYGIAGWYSMEASKQGLIGLSMTNTTKLVAPCFGAERMLGTNPIAVAVPCKGEADYVMDMATSCVAYGKVEINHRLGKSVPTGWCIGKDGRSTNDPAEMKDGGALLMLGSDRTRGAHKGYCLSSWVDIMTAVLSGANWGPYAPPFALRDGVDAGQERDTVGKGIGHFFMAFDVNSFRPREEFGAEMDKWVRRFKETKPVDPKQPVLIPGDPEREFEGIRGKEGVPLTLAVVRDLEDIAVKIGVSFDRSKSTRQEHLENMPHGGEADPRAANPSKGKATAAGGGGGV